MLIDFIYSRPNPAWQPNLIATNAFPNVVFSDYKQTLMMFLD